jgi:hypothetical protein
VQGWFKEIDRIVSPLLYHLDDPIKVMSFILVVKERHSDRDGGDSDPKCDQEDDGEESDPAELEGSALWVWTGCRVHATGSLPWKVTSFQAIAILLKNLADKVGAALLESL